MAQTNDIVQVNITKDSPAVSQAGFGIPLILTYHERFAERARVFTNLSDMLTANGGPYQSTDLEVQLATKVFSQNPSPQRVVMGRRQYPTTRTVDLTPVDNGGTGTLDSLPRASTDYTVRINSSDFTFTTSATPSVANITAGLVAAINAGTENVVATDNTTSIRIEAADAPGGVATPGVAFTLEYQTGLVESKDETPLAAGGAIADEIAAVSSENDDWYGLTGDFFGAAEIEAVALAIEPLCKVFTATVQDTDTTTPATTDINSLLQARALTRSWVNYHETPHCGISPAELGRNLPTIPGSITWKFKTLAGVTASKLTGTQVSNLQAKNAGFYRQVQGVNITCDGKTASGQFIDVTRGCDWLTSRIGEAVFSLFVNTPKVAYTDADFVLIENAVRGVLAQGVSNGLIASDPEFDVIIPIAANVPSNDRANRILTGITFCATLAGAVHGVPIQGKLTF